MLHTPQLYTLPYANVEFDVKTLSVDEIKRKGGEGPNGPLFNFSSLSGKSFNG